MEQKPTPEFRLDPADLSSSTWARLRKHMEGRREALRRQNDNPELSATDTAFKRGEIRALTNLLALGNPPAPAAGADEIQGE